MHTLIHADVVRASSPSTNGEARAGRLSKSADPPPRRAPRRFAARALAGAARRLDRESARKAIA